MNCSHANAETFDDAAFDSTGETVLSWCPGCGSLQFKTGPGEWKWSAPSALRKVLAYLRTVPDCEDREWGMAQELLELLGDPPHGDLVRGVAQGDH